MMERVIFIGLFVVIVALAVLAGLGAILTASDRPAHVAAFNHDCAAHGFAPKQCAFLLGISDQADDARRSADDANAAAAGATAIGVAASRR